MKIRVFLVVLFVSVAQTALGDIPEAEQLERLNVLSKFRFGYRNPKRPNDDFAFNVGLEKLGNNSYAGRDLVKWLEKVQALKGKVIIDCFLFAQIATLILDGHETGPFRLQYGRSSSPWNHPAALYLTVNRFEYPDVYVAMQLSDSSNKGMWVIQTDEDLYRYLQDDGVRETPSEQLLFDQINLLMSEENREPWHSVRQYEAWGIKPISEVLQDPYKRSIVYDPENWILDPQLYR
jgi:hypothetical protein